MRRLKNLAAKFLFAAMFGSVGTLPAYAGIPVVDGGNLAQNITTAMESVSQTLKQIEQYAMQVEQYQTQLSQLENQVQNTEAPVSYIWDQANHTISNLLEAQDILAYYQQRAGSLDAYLAKYQDAAYYRSSPCFGSDGCSTGERAALGENQRLASESQKKANDALFKGIAIQQNNLQTDARRLEQLQSAASTADGQVKAIQYASQIASQQANQLLQIRGLMLAQQSALAVRSQADADQEAKQLAAHESSTAARGPEVIPSNPKKW